MTRDANYSPFGPPRGKDGPTLRLVRACWRMRGPSGKVLECGIYRTQGPGVEVRCGYGADDLLRSQRTAEIGRARDIAAQWKRPVLGKHGFCEAG